MPMTTTATYRYEGPPVCVDCYRAGLPVCAHVGFNAEAWAGLHGQVARQAPPGLDPSYEHRLMDYSISEDRKTITVTFQTERPALMDLARHLSFYSDHRAKAAVHAVHHETGDTLERGHYDRPLTEGMEVCVDRTPYRVVSVEHPNRGESGTTGDLEDLQVARLMPIPTDTVPASPRAAAVADPS